MGNIIPNELEHDCKIYSIDNKQISFDNQHSKRKRSLIFTTVAWKRLVEIARRKGTKGSKVNPLHDNGCTTQSAVHQSLRSTERSSTQNEDQKKKLLYVIDTNPPKGLSNGVIDTKLILQQPRSNAMFPNGSLRTSLQRLHIPQLNNRQEQSREENPSSRIFSNIKPVDNSSCYFKNSHPSDHKESVSNNDVPKPSTEIVSQSAPGVEPLRKYVIQASTAELLECLGVFICKRCHLVPNLESIDVTTWIRGVDRALLLQGWQDITFIMPSSVCFVYMLCREMVPENAATVFEVQCILLTCLYMSYSYMGNEITYPLRPFLIEPERYGFWSRCCRIVNKLSGKMLRINSDAHFFTTIFRELKSYSPRLKTPSAYCFQQNSTPYAQKFNMPRAITVGGSAL